MTAPLDDTEYDWVISLLGVEVPNDWEVFEVLCKKCGKTVSKRKSFFKKFSGKGKNNTFLYFCSSECFMNHQGVQSDRERKLERSRNTFNRAPKQNSGPRFF